MWFYDYKNIHFEIIPQKNRYILIVNGERIGSYHSVNSAVSDIISQATGYSDWDMLDVCDADNIPESIADWNRT